jgi:hypothetical protein
MAFPENPLEVGQMVANAKLPVGIGMAKELGYRMPNWVGAMITGASLVQGAKPADWLGTMRSATGVVGIASGIFGAYEEAKGAADTISSFKRRHRLGLDLTRNVLETSLASTALTAQVLDVALPVARVFGLVTPSPVGVVVGAVSGSIGVVRAAAELGKATRFAALVRVVEAKKRGISPEARYQVLDRLAHEVASAVEVVVAGLGHRLEDIPKSAIGPLMGDAKREIAAVLSNRVGSLAAQKLITLATTYCSAVNNDHQSLDQGQVALLESLREAHAGIDRLRQLLVSAAGTDEQRKAVIKLADAVINSLRLDANLFRKRTIVKLCLSIGSLLLTLIGLVSLVFPPAAPIILLLQASIGLSLSLTNLATLRYDIALKRRANLEPLLNRVEQLKATAPPPSLGKKKKPEAPSPERSEMRERMPRRPPRRRPPPKRV